MILALFIMNGSGYVGAAMRHLVFGSFVLAMPFLLAACGASEVELRGRAFSDATGTGDGDPLAGATVTVSGDVSFSGVTDQDGAFVVTVPSQSRVLVELDAPGHVGLVEAEAIAGEDRDRDYGLSPEANVDFLLQSVGLERDPTRGILVVDFQTASTAGGETAAIDLDYEAVLTRTDTGALVLGDQAPAGGEDTFISFVNVTPGDATIVPESPTETCTVERDADVWPVFADTITTARVRCLPN